MYSDQCPHLDSYSHIVSTTVHYGLLQVSVAVR